MNIEFEKYQQSTTKETLDIDVRAIAKDFVGGQLDNIYDYLVDMAGYHRVIPEFPDDEYPDPGECFESIAKEVENYIRENWLK